MRTKEQYELLAALTILEKTRYMATAAQQLNYEVLLSLLPTLKQNLQQLNTICEIDVEMNNVFVMNFRFSLRTCILAHEMLVRVIENSKDNKSLYENVCSENKNCTLAEMCKCLDLVWRQYWQEFHIKKNHDSFLQSMEKKLTALYSAICIKGNENLPDNYLCLSCCKDSAYIKTGVTNECDEQYNTDSKSSSMDYCHHFIDIQDKCPKVNINRTIFERRMNEIGTKQQ